MTDTYIVVSGAMPTAAAVVPVTTGTAIKTLLQIKPATNSPLLIVEWGISFDAFVAAAPGDVELIETGTIFATVTAFAAADVMPYHNPNAPVNTAGASGIPLNLSTTASGFDASAEGTVVAGRVIDAQQIAPTGQYSKQYPLGREGGIEPGSALRIRTTFAAAINAVCYIIFEV